MSRPKKTTERRGFNLYLTHEDMRIANAIAKLENRCASQQIAVLIQREAKRLNLKPKAA